MASISECLSCSVTKLLQWEPFEIPWSEYSLVRFGSGGQSFTCRFESFRRVNLGRRLSCAVDDEEV